MGQFLFPHPPSPPPLFPLGPMVTLFIRRKNTLFFPWDIPGISVYEVQNFRNIFVRIFLVLLLYRDSSEPGIVPFS